MAKLASLFLLCFVAAYVAQFTCDSLDVKRKMAINNAAVSSGLVYSQFGAASQQQGNYEETITDGASKSGAAEPAAAPAAAEQAAETTAAAPAAEPAADAPAAEPAADASPSEAMSGSGRSITNRNLQPSNDQASNDAQYPDDDAPCVDTQKLGNVSVESVSRILKSEKGVFIPFSNFEGYEILNLLQRGSPLKGDEELANFCGHAVFTRESVVLHAFEGQTTRFADCIKTESGLSGACKANKDKSDHNSAYSIWISKYTVAWTDDDKYVLIVICFSNEKKIWLVFSSQTTIDGTTEETVLDKVGQLGLNKEQPFAMNYEGCKM